MLCSLLWAAGCSRAAAPEDATRIVATPPAGPELGGEGEAGERGEATDPALPLADRMLVKTASLTVRADDPAAAIDQAVALAIEAGGYSSSATSDGEDEDLMRASATLRVPVAAFERVMDSLRGSGELLHQQISTEDVTEAYVDLDARLRTQRALETRLVALIAQSQNVAETIEVERELARVRGTIESLDAQTKSLAGRAAMATIDISAVSPSSAEAGGFSSAMAVALDDAQSIAIGTVGALVRILGFMLPLWLIAVPTFLIVRRRRRKPPTPSTLPIPPHGY